MNEVDYNMHRYVLLCLYSSLRTLPDLVILLFKVI